VLAPLDVTNPIIILALGVIEQMSAGGKAAAMFTSAWPTYQNAYCKLAGECDGTQMLVYYGFLLHVVVVRFNQPYEYPVPTQSKLLCIRSMECPLGIDDQRESFRVVSLSC